MYRAIEKVQLPKFLTAPNPRIYLNGSYTVADFETSNHNFGSAIEGTNKLILAVWLRVQRDQQGCVWGKERAGEFEQRELISSVQGTQFLIGHNVKFELQWLRRCGLDLSKVVVYDTQIAEKVILGNRPGRLDLGTVAKRYGLSGKHSLGNSLVHSNEVAVEDVPEQILETYCQQDVWLTHEVFKAQLRVFDSFPELLPVVYTRCLLTPVLADVEFNGLKLDGDAVRTEFDKLQQETADLSATLRTLTGGINLNSPKQVGELLYNGLGFEETKDYRGNPQRTATGRPLTDSKTVSSLKAKTAKQKQFVDAYKNYNIANQALSKAISKFQECCDKGDILHAQFNQTVTQTHRLSSSGLAPYKVQFQNLPRRYKPLFIAKNPGWLIGEADGANLEFRVAGFLGQDEYIYADIVNAVDVHAFTSLVLTEAGQPTGRQDAKTHTFKPLYGGNSGTAAEKAYYKAFREKYWPTYNEQEDWVHQVLKTKKLRTAWGLWFYWPTTRVTNSGYIENTSSIFNYPVQSLATAEIIPIAVVFFWHLIRAHEAKMVLVNTVHDSIVAELPPEEQQLFKDLATEALTHCVYKYIRDVYDIKFNFPLGCGIKIGSHWGTGKEEKVNAVEPPFPFNKVVEV